MMSGRTSIADFPTKASAEAYGGPERWRLVKVTIRPRRNREREAVVAYLRKIRSTVFGSNVAFWAGKFADDIERGGHLK